MHGQWLSPPAHSVFKRHRIKKEVIQYGRRICTPLHLSLLQIQLFNNGAIFNVVAVLSNRPLLADR